MRQEAGGLSAFARKAGKIRRNQPVSGSAAPVYAGKRSILRIAADDGRKLTKGVLDVDQETPQFRVLANHFYRK